MEGEGFFSHMEKKKQPPLKNRYKTLVPNTPNHCQQGDFKMKIRHTDSKQKGQKSPKKKIRCWEIYWLCSSRSTFFNSKMIIWSSIILNLHWWRPQSSTKTLFFIFKKSFSFLIFVKWSKTFQKNQNFENVYVFSSFLEKSYCCRLRYFFTEFLKKSFNTWKSNFNPKKQVFEAWKSSKIDHLDGRHQCKFIFSLFSWNFGKSFKTLNFSNSYPQNDESKSCKISEIHKELLKKT